MIVFKPILYLNSSLLKSANPKDDETVLVLQQNSSSEVSSSIDSRDSVTANTTKDIRRDLPLKKRDPLTFQHIYGQQQQEQQGLKEKQEPGHQDVCCDSSWAAEQEASSDAEPVTSTNSSKKPAPRTCKGKRYLDL